MAKCQLFNAFFVGLLYIAPAMAQEVLINELFQSYQYNKVSGLLHDVKNLRELPELEFTTLLSERVVDALSTETQPQLKAVTDLFYETQSKIFSGKLITLKYCKKESECGFSAEYKLHEIHFQIDLVDKIVSNKIYRNPLSVLQYIAAHEMAHFVHEISTRPPYSSVVGLSIHGNTSAYRDEFTTFVNSLSESEKEEFYTGSRESKVARDFQVLVKKESLLGLRAHAEVDMMAVMILKNIGFTNWQDVLIFFDEAVREEKQLKLSDSYETILDFENRKRVILKTLSEE